MQGIGDLRRQRLEHVQVCLLEIIRDVVLHIENAQHFAAGDRRDSHLRTSVRQQWVRHKIRVLGDIVDQHDCLGARGSRHQALLTAQGDAMPVLQHDAARLAVTGPQSKHTVRFIQGINVNVVQPKLLLDQRDHCPQQFVRVQNRPHLPYDVRRRPHQCGEMPTLRLDPLTPGDVGKRSQQRRLVGPVHNRLKRQRQPARRAIRPPGVNLVVLQHVILRYHQLKGFPAVFLVVVEIRHGLVQQSFRGVAQNFSKLGVYI